MTMTSVNPKSTQSSNTTPSGGTKHKQSRPDDSQLAIRWKLSHADTAWGLGEWRRYADGVWHFLEKDVVGNEITTVLENARPEGVRVSNGLVNSVMEIARRKIFIPSEKWDADPDFLPMKNGILHIPTCTLFPHTPGIYATSRIEYDYDPNATCPNFLYALNSTIPNEAQFLQEFAGYALTPDVKHEISIWLQGTPGSGKSTIIGGIQTMLGARAGLLGLRDIERSRFALSNLPGKTLVVSTESPEIYISATDTINAIISGEPINVERKYYDAIEVIPRAKILWSMNTLPRISDANNGLTRRVKIIKFPKLPEDKKDVELKEKIILEGPGILNWALKGLSRLRLRGKFDVPKSVQDATKDYQEHNDIPQMFLDEIGARIDLTDPHCRTQSQFLYDQYSAWCQRNGHKPMSSTRMADEWKRLGFEKIKYSGSMYWLGVEITPFTVASNP